MPDRRNEIREWFQRWNRVGALTTALRRLDDTDWTTLRTAHGKADHFPKAIHLLLSSDPVDRRRGYGDIDNSAILQSDLYESAYFLTPILVELLRAKVPFGREEIYDLVFEIANGFAPHTETVQTFEGVIVSLKEACRQEVIKGIDIYEKDKTAEEDKIRKTVLDLLELLEERTQ